MSGMFNIFNESENRSSLSIHKGNDTSLSLGSSKLKSNGSTGLLGAKNALQTQFKSKGLSIRSKSDLNVAVSSNSTGNKLNPKDCLTLKDKSCVPVKRATSPLKMKTPKSKSLASITPKKLSPKVSAPKSLSPKMSSLIIQKAVDEYIFKKPATPKQQKKPKKYPEPEMLSYTFDQYEYMKEQIEQMFNDDRNFLKTVMKKNDKVVSIEDEGFISDSSSDSFNVSIDLSSSSISSSNIELPDISDCEE